MADLKTKDYLPSKVAPISSLSKWSTLTWPKQKYVLGAIQSMSAKQTDPSWAPTALPQLKSPLKEETRNRVNGFLQCNVYLISNYLILSKLN